MACLFQLVSHLGRDEVSLNFLFTQVNLLTLLGFFFGCGGSSLLHTGFL